MHNSSSSPSPSSSPGQPSLPDSPPTSAFEKWRRKAALITGLGIPQDERLAHLQMSHLEDCERRKEGLMNSSRYCLKEFESVFLLLHGNCAGPLLVFLLKHLALSNCDLPPTNIVCAPCDRTHAGGFVPDPGAIVLCAGNFFSKQHMESTIAHEVVHLYDMCRFKVDWADLRHHACSEVCALVQYRVCYLSISLLEFV